MSATVGEVSTSVCLGGIPADIRAVPRWIHWRPEPKANGKIDKKPTDPKTRENIDHTAKENWRTFDDAVALLGPGLGLGFYFNGDGYVGVDIDDCVGEDGTLSASAAADVAAFGSHAEISPSGRGVKIITRGELPPNDRKKGDREVYGSGRFFTITGNRIPGAPHRIVPNQEALDAFHAKYIARPDSRGGRRVESTPSDLSDEDIIRLAREARNGGKFSALWAGDTTAHGGDDSAADLALVSILAFWTQDPDQLDRLFRRSGLHREKWERADYRQRTIERALERGEVYESGRSAERPAGNGQPSNGAATKQSGSAGSAGSDWNTRQSLPALTPDAPTLPAEMIPAPLQSWLVDAANRTRVPLEMPTVAAITAVGGLIGRTIGIRPGRYDEHTVVPNVWGAMVARPGWMKTESYKEPFRPIGKLIAKARSAHETACRDMEGKAARIKAELKAIERRMALAARGDPPKEGKAVENLETLEAEYAVKSAEAARAVATERRYLTQDPTVEKFGELLIENPRGMILSRDELAGFLLALNKPGREGDREFYLEAWNGTGSFTVDRIGRGTLHIPSLTISIFGCIQPGKLKLLLDGATDGGVGDDGMMQRFQLLVAPDRLPEWKQPTSWGDGEAKGRADAIYAALDNLTPDDVGALAGDIPYLRYSASAQTFADACRDALEGRLRSGELDDTPAFASHLSKYRSLMPALALCFHLIDVAANTPGVTKGAVDESSARLAADWCDFLEAHARKVYAAETHRNAAAVHALVSKIKAGAIFDAQPVRDLYRAQWSGLRTQDKVLGALSDLSDLGWLRVETRDTGGNPSQIVRLHPDLIATTPTSAEGGESHA